MASTADRPIVLITGASGNLGGSIAAALRERYQIVGLDRSRAQGRDDPMLEIDLTEDDSVAAALRQVGERYGKRLAAVIHLVAYFDSSGEDHPLYQAVNVDGTRRLLRALRGFDVQRFIYAGTMLVHKPGKPGQAIDETQPFGPQYIYPKSKLQAEEIIRSERGPMPYAILRLAGVYDERVVVPTLANQIARIYERDLQSHFYPASPLVGQSMLHRDDMVDAFVRTVDRRSELPDAAEMLIGEPEPLGYDALQDEIGYLIHGQEDWPTLRLPKAIAAAGAWAQAKLEPVVPDALDQGEQPFIRPYMVAMADAHYALDIGRAQRLLGWQPRHRLKDALPAIVAALKRDPVGWYQANGATPPPGLGQAKRVSGDAEGLRAQAERCYRREHGQSRWAHFVNIALGSWLVIQPPLIGLDEPWLRGAEIVLGVALMVFACLSLSWQLRAARWVCAGIGALVMAAPFVFWTDNAAAFLSDTLVGALAFGLAVALPPVPGPSDVARMTGPQTPPGWTYNPFQFLKRRREAGCSMLRVFLFGDTDDGLGQRQDDEFDRAPAAVLRDMAAGGVSLPWNLWAAVAVGAWLMLTRITLGTDGAMANAEHLVGAVALTVLSVAAAEPARAARLLLVPLAAGLLAAALSLGEDPFAMAADAVAAVALAALGVRRGPIRARYGKWDRMII